jgi:hypothetical protein
VIATAFDRVKGELNLDKRVRRSSSQAAARRRSGGGSPNSFPVFFKHEKRGVARSQPAPKNGRHSPPEVNLACVPDKQRPESE